MDGVSALKIVRQKFLGIGFICLSGSDDPEHVKASFDAGATDYISKDNLPRLMDVLRREEERHK